MDRSARGLKYWSWRILGCDPGFAFALLAAQLWLGLLWFFYQDHGLARGAILGVLLLGLMVLRFRPRSVLTVAEATAGRTTPNGPGADWIWSRLGYGCALAGDSPSPAGAVGRSGFRFGACGAV